ncbi:MAG: PilZ domain-containing protein [Spirochaetota bacterium]
MKKDRRRYERFQLRTPARMTVMHHRRKKKKTLELHAHNICAGGAYFPTEHKLEEGTRVHLDLILSIEMLRKLEGLKGMVRVSGTVVRTDEEGIAVSFDKEYEMVPINNT